MSSGVVLQARQNGLHLNAFPVKVLNLITKLLSSFSIGWLYLCGDNTLNSKFRSGGVRIFVHRPDRTGKRLWPALVSRFQLKAFSLNYAPLPFVFPIEASPTYYYLHQTLDMLQPSLEQLKISGDFRFETVDLVARFPNLKYFSLSRSWDIHSNPHLLPPRLEKFMITHPDYKLTDSDLPPTLTYLVDTVLAIDLQASLSRNLKTLMLGTRVKEGPDVPITSLPPNLTRLLLGPTMSLKLDEDAKILPDSLLFLRLESLVSPKIFFHLPSGLLSLRIYGHGDEYQLSEIDIIRLPRNLTQLDVPHRATKEALCYLPRSLTLYEGLVNAISPTLSKMLPHRLRSLQSLFEGEAIVLPRHLFELDCSVPKLSQLILPLNLQKLTAWTAFNAFEPISFPPSLTSLVLVGKLWIDENTFASPSQLQHLSVVTAQEDSASCTSLINSFREFPHAFARLTRLVIVGGIFPDFLFLELPTTLESFSFTDGAFAMSSSLDNTPPFSLLTEKCLTTLPPKLRHLQLRLSTPFSLLPLYSIKHLSLRSIDVIARPSDLGVSLNVLKSVLPKLSFLAINSYEFEQDLYIYSVADALQLKLFLHLQPTAGEIQKPSIDPLSELA